MAIHIGWEHWRWSGLVVAGLAFILPAMAITGASDRFCQIGVQARYRDVLFPGTAQLARSGPLVHLRSAPGCDWRHVKAHGA